MGNNTTFNVNDDGSVTVAEQLSEEERNIIEILRIEKSKGGVFASRRMKKRAVKYAKSINYPEFKVKKLMLDSYPDDFSNYPKTTLLFAWLSVALLFLIGGVIVYLLAAEEYRYVSRNNERIYAIEEYQRLGYNEKYHLSDYYERDESGKIPNKELVRRLEEYKRYRNDHLTTYILILTGALGCAAVVYFSIRQYIRIAKDIKQKQHIKPNSIKFNQHE